MTFKQAKQDLFNKRGDDVALAAKRPSMRGYVVREEAIVEDQEPVEQIVLVKADGTRTVLGDDAIPFTKEVYEAFALGEDWELAPVAECEKARAGEGTM